MCLIRVCTTHSATLLVSDKKSTISSSYLDFNKIKVNETTCLKAKLFFERFASFIVLRVGKSDCESGSDDTLKMGQKFIFSTFFPPLTSSEKILEVFTKKSWLRIRSFSSAFQRLAFGWLEINCVSGKAKGEKSKQKNSSHCLPAVTTARGNSLFIQYRTHLLFWRFSCVGCDAGSKWHLHTRYQSIHFTCLVIYGPVL